MVHKLKDFLPLPKENRGYPWASSDGLQRALSRRRGWHYKILLFPASVEWKYELTSGLARPPPCLARDNDSVPITKPSQNNNAAPRHRSVGEKPQSFLEGRDDLGHCHEKTNRVCFPVWACSQSLFTDGWSHRGRCGTYIPNSCSIYYHYANRNSSSSSLLSKICPIV